MNIYSLFEKCAQTYGASPAMRELDSGRSLSFIELRHELDRVRAGLEANAIGVGERVGLLGSADANYLVCDYGVMASGRVRVPMDPSLSCDEQAAQLRDAGALMLIHDAAHASRAAELSLAIPHLKVLTQESLLSRAVAGTTPRDGSEASALASLSYTGGTTGSPKAVMITHGSLTSTLQNIIRGRDTRPGEILLNVRPAWPIAAVILLAQLAAGGTVLLGGKFEPSQFLQQLQTHGVTATSLVPTHLTRLMDETDPSAFDLSKLKSIDVGAAAIPAELFARLVSSFGPRIGVLYGLTEASWSCYLPPMAMDVDPDLMKKRMTSVGRALFGVEVCIRSTDGQPVPAGEEGEITLRGSHLMAGYWNKPEITAEVMRNGWFHTGDLGKLDDEGYLYVTGRIKEVIRSGGRSVLPAEVEAVLLAHPAVAEAVVLGLPDPEWGEIVAAAVVLRPVHEGVSEDQLIDWCRERLSSFKKPRKVFVVGEIPRSHYGKPQRAKLRDQLISNR